jgi:phospholipid/cholesterol/gamma-HCH transport system permease protein
VAASVAYAGVRGYGGLLWDVLTHLSVIGREPVRQVLVRQMQRAGVATLSALAVRAAGIGTLIIAYTVYVLAADAAVAVRILIWAVLREIGPLFAVIMLVMRSGTSMAAEFALMRERGEVQALRLSGIRALDYIIVPTVVAMTVSNLVITVYFQMLAVGGGMLISALLMDVTLHELGEHFFSMATIWDLVYTVVKSLGFGLLVGMVVCVHGLGLGGRPVPMPEAVSRAVMQSFAAVLAFNGVFAYLVFGVALFGIVRAPS